MPNEIVKQSTVLSRIGAPDEREYLVAVMAEQLGIPSSETGRPDVVAVIATAAQRSMEYGWVPGVHMHVQSFYSEKEGKTKYTLVDGEKAWKDSASRWKHVYGVNWRIQRKRMTREELIEEIRLMGYDPKNAAANAFGIWARVIIVGEDDPGDDEDPFWETGIWFGKISVGGRWRDDYLPTGTSSRNVARRRADKAALMASELTLIPLDDRGKEQRTLELTDNLRREYEVRNPKPNSGPKLKREPDGDLLFPEETEEPEDIQFYEVAEEADQGEPQGEAQSLTGADWEKYAYAVAGDLDIPGDTYNWIMAWRSKMIAQPAMSAANFGRLARLVDDRIGDGATVHRRILTCIAGARIDAQNRPGDEGKELLKSLMSEDEDDNIKHLRIVLALCEMIEEEEEEE